MKLKVQVPARYYAIAEDLDRRQKILENMMGKKETISILMLSPLYFTIPVQKRIELVKSRRERLSLSNFYKDILEWVKTGNLNQ